MICEGDFLLTLHFLTIAGVSTEDGRCLVDTQRSHRRSCIRPDIHEAGSDGSLSAVYYLGGVWLGESAAGYYNEIVVGFRTEIVYSGEIAGGHCTGSHVEVCSKIDVEYYGRIAVGNCN